MNKNIFILLSVFVIIAGGCDKFNKYPGFKKAGKNIYYQLQVMGEDTTRAKPGDYITVDLGYYTMNDSQFFTGSGKFQVSKPAFSGSIDECFGMLAEGESAKFIIPADSFFYRTLQSRLPQFILPGSMVKITVNMLDIQTEEEYLQEKEAFLSWIADFGDYEKILLEQYIVNEKLNIDSLPSGIYYLSLTPGKGKKIEEGDTVTVNYEGRFLNGRFFDSTVKRNQPFQFVYGTEWQVIRGLEEAIGMMSEGEKALIILPSEMAFGNTGSSNNFIPPFTSLIFEVEILKVSS